MHHFKLISLPLFVCLIYLQLSMHAVPTHGTPVEYEYYYEEDYKETPPEQPRRTTSTSSKAAAAAAAVATPTTTTTTTTGKRNKPARQQQQQPEPQKDSNYDIEDLVKAWREYLKEKRTGEEEAEEAAVEDEEPPTAPRPRGKAKKKPSRVRQPEPEVEEYEEEEEPEEEYECEPRSESYRTADPKQCDKYYECNIKGEEAEKLCPDGLVFDIFTQNCDYPAKVDCTLRPALQPAQPSTNCSRANGFFPFPAEESCQKFWDCRGGKAYLQICPEGVIFDPKIDACVTPDQSARPECAAGKFLGFECPTYTEDQELRFGNHDRLPDPNDCVQFFSCLRSGQPRLGKCPKKTVFNAATGHCTDPKGVTGCETYWSEKEKENGEDYKDYY